MKTKQFKISPVKGSSILKMSIKNSQDAFDAIKQFWTDDIEVYESFFILLLDRVNNTIGWAKISQGGICGTVVDKKIVCKYVVDSLASSVILAHNHPSGSLRASKEDIKITRDLKQCLLLFDCQLFDHIIVTPNGSYTSIADTEGI